MDEIIIDIEVCYNCKKHNWFTHHAEKKYDDHYNIIKNQLIQDYSQVIVNKNRIPIGYVKIKSKNSQEDVYYNYNTNHALTLPRIGAFEINICGILIYSKLKSKSWPYIPNIVALIKKIIEEKRKGNDISIYGISDSLNLNISSTVDTNKMTIGKSKLSNDSMIYKNSYNSNSNSLGKINSRKVKNYYRLQQLIPQSQSNTSYQIFPNNGNLNNSGISIPNKKPPTSSNTTNYYRAKMNGRSATPNPTSKNESQPLKLKYRYPTSVQKLLIRKSNFKLPRCLNNNNIDQVNSSGIHNMSQNDASLNGDSYLDAPLVKGLDNDNYDETLIDVEVDDQPRSHTVDPSQHSFVNEDLEPNYLNIKEKIGKKVSNIVSDNGSLNDKDIKYNRIVVDKDEVDVQKTAQFPKNTYANANSNAHFNVNPNGSQSNLFRPGSSLKAVIKSSERYANDVKFSFEANDSPKKNNFNKITDSIVTFCVPSNENEELIHSNEIIHDDPDLNHRRFTIESKMIEKANFRIKKYSSGDPKNLLEYSRSSKTVDENKNRGNMQEIDQNNIEKNHKNRYKSTYNNNSNSFTNDLLAIDLFKNKSSLDKVIKDSINDPIILLRNTDKNIGKIRLNKGSRILIKKQ